MRISIKRKMSNNSTGLFRVILFLFGSYALGFNFATVLHEFGHAMAMWTTGGVIERIVLNPFSWSFVCYGSTPKYPILTAVAGVVFGTCSALLLMALVWRYRHHSWAFTLIMTGIAATMKDGLYAIVDSILLSGGDLTILIQLGIPKIWIVSIGMMLFLIGIFLAVVSLHLIINPNDTLLKRIIILEGAFLPYTVCVVTYHYIYKIEELGLWSLYAVCKILFLLIVAILSCRLKVWRPSCASYNPSLTYATFVAISGISIILLELLYFNHNVC